MPHNRILETAVLWADRIVTDR